MAVGFLSSMKVMCEQLYELILILLDSFQLSLLRKWFCKFAVAISTFLFLEKMAASSTQINFCISISKFLSVIVGTFAPNKKYKIGSRTLPCGTSALIFRQRRDYILILMQKSRIERWAKMTVYMTVFVERITRSLCNSSLCQILF